MFYERLKVVKKQMQELQKTMDMLKYKYWYYNTAFAAGTEEALKDLPTEEMPSDIQKYKRAYFESVTSRAT